MSPEDAKWFVYYNRKTKRELIEMLRYATDKKRLNREYLVSILYDIQKVWLSVDNCTVLPNSEQREIISHLREAENILKFNISEIDKEGTIK